jgi:hypothetical protein
MSAVAKSLLVDASEAVKKRKALVTFIEEMGYSISPRSIPLSIRNEDNEGDTQLVVHELKDVDDEGRIVPFSFLFDPVAENGTVLPFPFTKYETLVRKKKTKSKS